MKFLALIFAVAVAHAVPVNVPRTIEVVGDGSIVIAGPRGNLVAFTAPIGLLQQGLIEVIVTGPTVPTQRIYISPAEGLQGPARQVVAGPQAQQVALTQIQILRQILGQYQGIVSPVAFQSLLARVQQAVQNDVLTVPILEVLQIINQGQVQVLGELLQGVQGVREVQIGGIIPQGQVRALVQQLEQGLEGQIGQGVYGQGLRTYGQGLGVYGGGVQGVVGLQQTGPLGVQGLGALPWYQRLAILRAQGGLPIGGGYGQQYVYGLQNRALLV